MLLPININYKMYRKKLENPKACWPGICIELYNWQVERSKDNS